MTDFILAKDVPVPMADGTLLATDVWRPASGDPVPALLVRTPYGKEDMSTYVNFAPSTFDLIRAGYAVVVQDVRGVFGSGGVFAPHVHEAEDGAEAVRWLAAQEWCDGAVGAWGGSYLGMVQWQVAATGMPELKAIAPSIASADLYRSPWYSPGGALSLDIAVRWSTMMAADQVSRALEKGEGEEADLRVLSEDVADPTVAVSRTPVIERPVVARYLPGFIDSTIGRPERDDHWAPLAALDKAGAIVAPALNIGGWYDLLVGETITAYTTMRKAGGSPEARDGQRLVIGPWSHRNTTGVFPDRHFGSIASFASNEMTAAHIAFYDRWLKGCEDALDGVSPVRIFVMGIDQWRDEPDWPLPDTRYTSYYLAGDGPANTAAGRGVLSTTPPMTDGSDRYLYDPVRPVPTLGGTVIEFSGYDGPADQRPVHDRDDVLCFRSEVLTSPVEVTGPVTAVFHVSSTAVDTDFTAKLVDVHPDGRAIILCDGILRMRYRSSLEKPEPLVPGEIYEVTIDLLATSNVFLPGHRILLEVSSSNFPRYDRNSNTGGEISREHLADMVPATNTLYRSAKYPSRVILPVISR
ncbi:CocE/NonD family hydrolase [Amycolatopsis thailandensis]|uniref:CocE/NonD family hydrolase n=1 Tax=Amycolatopsis thailandensis TaxID=589330 RepID=UPI0036356F9A